MSGSNRTSSIKVQGYAPKASEDLVVQDLLIGPDYAATLGIPLLRGRDIGVRDTPAAGRVAVVNETFVERYFKNENPLGRIFTFDDETDSGAPLEIVGVIGDIKSSDPRQEPLPSVYRRMVQIQDDAAYANSIHLRTSTDPSILTPAVRQAIEGRCQPSLFDVTSLTLNEGQLAPDRLITQLVSFFGLLALLLALDSMGDGLLLLVAQMKSESNGARGTREEHCLDGVARSVIARLRGIGAGNSHGADRSSICFEPIVWFESE
jgi:hypothetical protein